MRNLKVTSCKVLPAEGLISCAHCFCLDCDRDTVWIASSSDLCCIDGNRVCSMAPLSSHMTSCDRVIGMEYLTDVESVCVVLRSGNILLYNVTTSELESVGEVEVGVVCMGWSPEQDVVAIVTADHKLILMTKDFDPLVETPLHKDDFGSAKPVNVGWGKKETQFHGSEGKIKPGQKLQEKIVEPALSWDDRATRISWRGDGEYFACSAIDPSETRVIRVWSRECVHHSTCEAIKGLEHPLAWRPSGGLLASTQFKPHRNDIVFFERNGLQHGEFPFLAPPTDVQVKELAWSCDSAVLGVWCYRRGSGEEWVQLWSVGNYHWYLKQEIRLRRSGVKDDSSHPTSLVGLAWDPMTPLKLHLLTLGGQYLVYTWNWTISESQFHSHSNSAGVAVIDGSQVLYTPLRYSIIPPPMSSIQLCLPAPANELAFSPPPCSNDFLVLLSDFRIAVFSLNGAPAESLSEHESTVMVPKLPQLMGVTSIGEVTCCFHALRQLVWWREDSVLAVSVSEEEEEEEEEGGGESRESVVLFSLEIDRDNKAVHMKKCCSVMAPGPISCLHGNPDTGTVAVQLVTGEIMRFSRETETSCKLSPWLLHSGLSLKMGEQLPCDKIRLALFNQKECVVGLCSSRSALYVDDLKVASGCTSFAIHDEFLLLTTNSHTCRFISLNSDPKVLPPLVLDEPRKVDENIRRVERGSQIVTVISADTRLILQMPRGNLETIHPRALVLTEVRKKLDQLEFRKAFVIMRKHRINLNLIYDHNPKTFLDNIPIFLNQLASVEYINLFLTDLMEEDVCTTMYSAGKREEAKGGVSVRPHGDCKVDTVCIAVRKELVKMGENTYLLSIITTYVKLTKPELEIVLSMIERVKESESKLEAAASSEPKEPTSSVVTVDKALKYTMYLVDVNDLYNIALGMYNLPLVVMVAERSQMDPKEYLPFLNELNRLPLEYRCFKIDSSLKRYSKALGHIAKCGSEKFEECLSLIKAHSLYKEALSIYTDRNSNEYKSIASAYGHYLSSDRGLHKDAGLIFSQCGCYEESFAAFEKASCWEQAFVISSLLHHTASERMEAARRIAKSLKSDKRFSEASHVLLDYAEDIEESMVALLDGACWEESLRQLHLHNRLDLIETHLLPGLLEAHLSMLSLFGTLRSDFERYSSRLLVVRKTKKQKQIAIFEGTYAADEKDADLFSETSSMTGRSALSSSLPSSQYTKASGRSSKNRRKSERKKLSLREGGTHEEEALLEELKKIVSSVDGLQEEVGGLLVVMVPFGYTKEASAVQRDFSELLEYIKCKSETVWVVPPVVNIADSANMQGRLGPAATVNSIMAAMATPMQQHPAGSSGSAPKLRDNVKWRLNLLT